MDDGNRKTGLYCAYCSTMLKYLEVSDNISGETKKVIGCPNCWRDPEAVGELVFGRFRASQ